MPRARPKAEVSAARKVTKLEFQELARCQPSLGLDGFIRFCTHVKIADKESKKPIRFDLWDCQRRLAGDLVDGRWIIAVKPRQVGITWLLSAYADWRMTFERFYTVVITNQGLLYAIDFVTLKFRFIHDRLPDFMRLPILNETKTFIRLGSEGAEGHHSELHAVAGNAEAGRSHTANLWIADEAAYVERLEECQNAIEPTLLNVAGQAVQISTSSGPSGQFFKNWEVARKGRSLYTPIFFPYDVHPKRDQAWYDAQAAAHAEDPNYMKREFPRTAQEAFEASGGRIYPWFGRDTHAMTTPVDVQPFWRRYRCLDWGESHSAFVCLWVLVIPSDKPKLTYDPSLIHFPDEMLAYAWKEKTISGDDEPDHTHSHVPDALRYGICTYIPDGETHDGKPAHVHVYRELVIPDPVGKGHTSQTLICRMKEMSGWRMVNPEKNQWAREKWCEQYEATVFDRSRPMLENEFSQFGESAEPHFINTVESVTRKEEVRTGIIMVNRLVVGALPPRATQQKTPDQERKEFEAQPNIFAQVGLRSTVPIVQIIRRNAERRKQRAAMKRRRHPYLGVT